MRLCDAHPAQGQTKTFHTAGAEVLFRRSLQLKLS